MKEPKREDYEGKSKVISNDWLDYIEDLEKYIAYLKDRPTITEDRDEDTQILIDKAERVRDLYRNKRYTQSDEEMRELSEHLDDYRRT